MDIMKLSLMGIITVIFCIFLKSYKSEWALFLSIAAGILMAVYLTGFLADMTRLISQWDRYLGGMDAYIRILWKAIGITYLCEFAAGISRDAGNGLIASQIELGGKIAVLMLGMPVLGALLETISGYYTG